MQTVLILGGTGFVGRALTLELQSRGWRVAIASRQPGSKQVGFGNEVIWANYSEGRIHTPEDLKSVQAIVNLAGVSLADGRWTPTRKREILESRLDATRAAVQWAKEASTTPAVLVNASAVGFYGTSETAVFTEDSQPVRMDFLSSVCRDWEAEAVKAEELGIRVVLSRLGLVLGNGGGALPKMSLPYRFYGGGPVGTGQQWESWIHIEDVVGMLAFAIENQVVQGPLNVVAPHPVPMGELGEAIGRALQRPHWLPVPTLALRLLLGETADLLLLGQRVLPEKAQKLGYAYRFANLDDALRELLH